MPPIKGLICCFVHVCEGSLTVGTTENSSVLCSDLRHGPVTCRRFTLCLPTERSELSAGAFGAFQSRFGRVNLKAPLCTGLVMELSLLGWQHTMQWSLC